MPLPDGKGHTSALYINPTPFPKQGPVRASASNPKPKVRQQIKTKRASRMAERLSLTLPPTMAAFTASSRILPAASRARVSLAYSPPSSSASLSSLKCLGSSPLVSRLFLNQVQSLSIYLSLFNYLFVFVLIVDEKSSLIFVLVSDYLSETISGGSCCVGERPERRGYSEMRGVRS